VVGGLAGSQTQFILEQDIPLFSIARLRVPGCCRYRSMFQLRRAGTVRECGKEFKHDREVLHRAKRARRGLLSNGPDDPLVRKKAGRPKDSILRYAWKRARASAVVSGT